MASYSSSLHDTQGDVPDILGTYVWLLPLAIDNARTYHVLFDYIDLIKISANQYIKDVDGSM